MIGVINNGRRILARVNINVRQVLWVGMLSGGLLSGMTPASWAASSYYFGALLPYNTIDTFGGGTGSGGFLGYRTNVSGRLRIPDVKYGYVLSYLQSDHKLKRRPIHAGYQLITLEIKYDFLTRKPTQPYLALGIGHHTLDIDGPEGKLTGYGYNLRVGAQYFLTQRISVGSDISFRAARMKVGQVLGLGGVWVGFTINSAFYF